MKKYDPLTLDTAKNPPSFENEKAKFWLVARSKTRKHTVFYVEPLKTYVLVRGKKIVDESRGLEQILLAMEVFDKALEKGWFE